VIFFVWSSNSDVQRSVIDQLAVKFQSRLRVFMCLIRYEGIPGLWFAIVIGALEKVQVLDGPVRSENRFELVFVDSKCNIANE
jgi:hypothetical protein